MDMPEGRHIHVADDISHLAATADNNISSLRHKSSNVGSLESRSTKEKDAIDLHADERDIRTKQVKRT